VQSGARKRQSFCSTPQQIAFTERADSAHADGARGHAERYARACRRITDFLMATAKEVLFSSRRCFLLHAVPAAQQRKRMNAGVAHMHADIHQENDECRKTKAGRQRARKQTVLAHAFGR